MSGEWAKPGVLMISSRTSGQGKPISSGKQVILYPPEYRDGELMAPFAK